MLGNSYNYLGQVTKSGSLDDFLKNNHKPSRYTERGVEYVQAVRLSAYRDVENYGYTLISGHDSLCGETVIFRPLADPHKLLENHAQP